MTEPAKAIPVDADMDFAPIFEAGTVTDITDSDTGTDAVTEWMTVKQAAKALDISERSVFRRIKKGQLLSKKEDGNTYVSVKHPDVVIADTDDRHDVSGNDDRQSLSVSHPESAVTSHLLDMVGELSDKLEEANRKLVQAAGRAGYLEATTNELRNELEAKGKTLKLLEDKQSQLTNVQYHYEQLEEENYQLKEELVHLKTRSGWMKFCDWFLGKKI